MSNLWLRNSDTDLNKSLVPQTENKDKNLIFKCFYFFKACHVKLVKITHKIRETPPWKLLYQFEYPAWNLLKYFSLGDSHLFWYMCTIGIRGDPSDENIFGNLTRAYNFRAALFYHWYMPRQLYPLADLIKNCKWVSTAADLD